MQRDIDQTTIAEIEDAEKTLIQCDDTDAANYIALSLAVFVTKGNTKPVNEAGREILRRRPKKSTREFLESLATSVQNKNEQVELNRMLSRLN